MKVGIAGKKDDCLNYVAVAENLGHHVLIGLDVSELSDCDFLILPGGGDLDPVFYGEEEAGSVSPDRNLDEAQFAVLDFFVKNKRPVLGICRGHQLINVYFGGSLLQDITFSSDVRHREKEGGEDLVHPVLCPVDSIFKDLYGEKFAVNTYHHQAVKKLGDGLEVLLVAEDGIVEAFCHRSLPVFAVQFHPERMCFSKARPDTVDAQAFFQYVFNLQTEG